jgi:isoleucyl-tRNA synthetase
LYDFNPDKDRVPYERLPELDRWALHRLNELISRVRTSYDEFEFHTIFHALNNFCSVDLSAVYLDILKDRLYTFRADSPLRRGSQTVLFEILVAMTKLMAPVLSFTAEEIWRTLETQSGGHQGVSSVHLSTFPEIQPQWQDAALAEQWERLLKYRSQVQGVLEERRREKIIGSSLEARVHLTMDSRTGMWIKNACRDLDALFIVSEVTSTIQSGAVSDSYFEISVTKSTHAKCERCWNYRKAVGQDASHPTLCDRCVEAVQ